MTFEYHIDFMKVYVRYNLFPVSYRDPVSPPGGLGRNLHPQQSIHGVYGLMSTPTKEGQKIS